MSHDLSPDGDRHRLRIERTYPHPAAKVWRAITDPAELSGWFPARVETDLAVGATMTFTFPGEPPVANGTITEVDPPRVFGFDWGGELFRWELRPDGDGTLVVFTHVFDDRARAASFAAGWDGCFDGLAHLLDGEPVGEPAPYPPRHESFVELFGLGDGRVVGADVVFDRVYPSNREVVVEAFLAQGPVEGEVVWAAEDVPGGSRIKVTVPHPADVEGALRHWRQRLSDVAGAVSTR